MQEIDLDNSVDKKELEMSNFSLELENNSLKSRVGIYISSSLKYSRKADLEGDDSNILIVDILSENPIRIINVYRSFNPQNNESQRAKFLYKLTLMKSAQTRRTLYDNELPREISHYFILIVYNLKFIIYQ